MKKRFKELENFFFKIQHVFITENNGQINARKTDGFNVINELMDWKFPQWRKLWFGEVILLKQNFILVILTFVNLDTFMVFYFPLIQIIAMSNEKNILLLAVTLCFRAMTSFKTWETIFKINTQKIISKLHKRKMFSNYIFILHYRNYWHNFLAR